MHVTFAFSQCLWTNRLVHHADQDSSTKTELIIGTTSTLNREGEIVSLIPNKSIKLQSGVKLHRSIDQKVRTPRGLFDFPTPIIAPIVPPLELISPDLPQIPPIFGPLWSNAVKWPQNNWSRVLLPPIHPHNRPCTVWSSEPLVDRKDCKDRDLMCPSALNGHYHLLSFSLLSLSKCICKYFCHLCIGNEDLNNPGRVGGPAKCLLQGFFEIVLFEEECFNVIKDPQNF